MNIVFLFFSLQTFYLLSWISMFHLFGLDFFTSHLITTFNGFWKILMTFKVFFVSLLCYCHVIIKIKFYCCCFSVFILFNVVDLTTMREFRQSLTVEMNLRDFLGIFFSVRLLSVLRGHSVFSSPAQTANDFRLPISIPDYFPILIHEKEPVFSLLNVQC